MSDSHQKNTGYACYPSRHMICADETSLRALHDEIARFIATTHGSLRSAN